MNNYEPEPIIHTCHICGDTHDDISYMSDPQGNANLICYTCAEDHIYCETCQKVTEHFDDDYKGPIKVCSPCYTRRITC